MEKPFYMRVILDTNFMMDCFRYKVDIATIFELYPGARMATVVPVVRELKSLAAKKSTHGRYAKVAMKLIDGFYIIDTKATKADDALLEAADKDNIVATNDEKLRKRIKGRKGLKTIYLRGRKELAVS